MKANCAGEPPGPKELEAENTRLKKIVAQQALDIDALKDLLGKGL